LSYINAIERLLDKKLPITKVPGPWADKGKTSKDPSGIYFFLRMVSPGVGAGDSL
jgi:hypothetical protein